MKREIIVTADGSHSLYIKELDEHYHSTNGAIQESNHIFIEAGLKSYIEKYKVKSLSVFEVGLGTGLNALLTLILANELKVNIDYTTIEAYPLSNDIIDKLNYPSLIKKDNSEVLFKQIHAVEWEKEITISPYFSITKINNKLNNYHFTTDYNLVYFDAFAPDVQPELWTEEVFDKMFSIMKSKSFLLTYCAKGIVKRAMKKAGFIIEPLPGPPGKREIVRAIKSN